MTARIGQFLAFIGLIIMVIFCATDQVQSPVYGLFCTGAALLIMGGVLYVRDRPEPQPSSRFSRWKRKQDEPEKKRHE
jgi:hypothetical protein